MTPEQHIIDFLTEAYNSVGKFHAVFGDYVYNPDEPERELSPEKLALRLSLIEEETKETVEALMVQDAVEVADGLCDMLVVAFGAGHCLNVPCFTRADNSEREVEVYNNQFVVEDIPSLFSQCFYDISQEYLSNCCTSIVGLFSGINHLYPHLNLEENFREVMRTNMNKFFTDKQECLRNVELYNLKGVNCSLSESVVGDEVFYWIKREDGKLLKGHNWEAPNIIVY